MHSSRGRAFLALSVFLFTCVATLRVSMGSGFSGGGGGGGGASSLQAAYNGGKTITTSGGTPVVINAPGGGTALSGVASNPLVFQGGPGPSAGIEFLNHTGSAQLLIDPDDTARVIGAAGGGFVLNNFTTDSVGNVIPSVQTGENPTNANAPWGYVMTCNGPPTGTPANYVGNAAFAVDRSTGTSYAFYGAAWHSVGGGGSFNSTSICAGTTPNPLKAIAYGAGFLWAVSDFGFVAKLDPTSRTLVVQHIATGGGGVNSRGICFDPVDSSMWVTNQGGGPVQVIDTGTNTVTTTPLPAGTSVSSGCACDGTSVYVGAFSSTGKIGKYDAATHALITSFALPGGADPTHMVWDSGNSILWITSQASNLLFGMTSAGSFTYTGIATGTTPYGVTCDNGAHVWVANTASNSVTVVDATSGTVLTTITLAGDPASGQCMTYDGHFAWVACAVTNTAVRVDAAMVRNIIPCTNAGSMCMDASSTAWCASTGSSPEFITPFSTAH